MIRYPEYNGWVCVIIRTWLHRSINLGHDIIDVPLLLIVVHYQLCVAAREEGTCSNFKTSGNKGVYTQVRVELLISVDMFKTLSIIESTIQCSTGLGQT